MPWLAGAAKRSLEIPAGVHLSGFVGREQPATSVLDQVYVRALALGNGSVEAIIVSCDVLGFEVPDARRIRQAVSRRLGISPTAVLLAATHTHAGPATQALRRCGKVEEGWLTYLQGVIEDVATAAVADARAARIAGGVGTAHLAVNRRNPAGPLDPAVGAWRIEGLDGRPVAILCHFACHPVVLGRSNRLVSADYPGRTVRALERLQGGGVALFLNGAAGDVNPAPVLGVGSPGASAGSPGSSQAIDDMGGKLARVAWEAALRAPWQPAAPIRSRQTTIALPLTIDPEVLRREIGVVRAASQDPSSVASNDFASHEVRLAMQEWADQTEQELQTDSLPRTLSMDLQAIAVGPWKWVAVPAEVFVQTALDLKRLDLKCFTYLVGYANGNVGYIPTAAEYPRGGYEVAVAHRYYGYPAAVTVEAEGLLAQELAHLVQAVDQ